MYAYFRLIRNSSLFGLFCLASLAQASENSIWTIDSRSLPTPAAASGALSSTLANLPAPNIATSSQHPASDIEWRAFIDAADAARLVPLELLEQTYKVNIEKGEIAALAFTRSRSDFAKNQVEFLSVMAAPMCRAEVIMLWPKQGGSCRLRHARPVGGLSHATRVPIPCRHR